MIALLLFALIVFGSPIIIARAFYGVWGFCYEASPTLDDVVAAIGTPSALDVLDAYYGAEYSS